MARPRKYTVDYFSHDTDASTKKTLMIIESKFGNNGYTFWFKLLELLGASPRHFLDCRNDAIWEFLQAKTRLDESLTNDILTLLAKLDAIDGQLWQEAKIIWSQNFVDRIADVYKNRRQDIPQKPNSNSQNPILDDIPTPRNHDQPNVSNLETTQTKLKETKLKNIIKDDKKLSPDIGLKVKEVFGKIDELRGYRPPKRKAEAASIIRMLKSYTPDQILEVYEKLKADKFWHNKELFMMSVETQIGAIMKDGTHRGNTKKAGDSEGNAQEDGGKYTSGRYGRFVRR